MTDLSSASPEIQPDAAAESEISRLIQQANEDQPDSRAFMEPKSGPGKRGRKRKNPDDPKWKTKDSGPQEQAQPGAGQSSDQGPGTNQGSADFSHAFRGLFSVGSGLLVRASGVPEAALTTGEIDSLSVTWGAVASKYMPAFMASHAELVCALTVTGAVGIRIHMVLSAEIEKRKKAEAELKAKAMDAEFHSV